MTDLQTQADAKTVPAITILGLPVHRVNMQEALDIVDRFVRERKPRHIITADASMLVMAQEDRELRSILLAADLITPDSAGCFGRRGGRERLWRNAYRALSLWNVFVRFLRRKAIASTFSGRRQASLLLPPSACAGAIRAFKLWGLIMGSSARRRTRPS